MDRTALHLEVRNALSLSDELSRHEHARGDQDFAAHLSALRTLLGDLERDVGRYHDRALAAETGPAEHVALLVEGLRERRSRIPSGLRHRLELLVASADRVRQGLEKPEGRVPSKPVLGLPLARVVPQDVHSVLDYAGALGYFASAALARTPEGRAAGIALGSSVAGVSLVTDYRLSAVKILPIEMHEVLDHVSGLSAAAAPFLLGYAKKDPVAAVVQIATGLLTVVASLFTDYRASVGVTRPLRSKGGPDAGATNETATRGSSRSTGGRVRVPDAQRPLEGLSSAPSDWRPDGGGPRFEN
jgi:hypothetical protein